MKKFKSIIKLLFVNVLIVVILLLFVNWAAGVLVRSAFVVPKQQLPVYTDVEKAKAILKDWRSAKSEYAPFIAWKKKAFNSSYMNIDSAGRRYNPKRIVGEDSLKIAFFGGSTLIGQGVDDAHTIPALVDSINSDIYALNFGQIGFNARQELAFLINEYSSGKSFDYVIFYDGVNEVLSLCRSEIQDLPNHMRSNIYQNRINKSVSNLFIKEVFNAMTENILELVKKIKSKSSRTNSDSGYNCCENKNDKAKNIARQLLQEWKMANSIVNAQGGKFIAILQPIAYIGEPKLSYLEINKGGIRDNYLAVYNEILLLLKEEYLPFVYDFTEVFNLDEPIYTDECHVADAGNLIVAKRIIELIK